MTLADGSHVESSLPSTDESAETLAGWAYRLRRPDGSEQLFADLRTVLDHLRDHYSSDDLGRSVIDHMR